MTSPAGWMKMLFVSCGQLPRLARAKNRSIKGCFPEGALETNSGKPRQAGAWFSSLLVLASRGPEPVGATRGFPGRCVLPGVSGGDRRHAPSRAPRRVEREAGWIARRDRARGRKPCSEPQRANDRTADDPAGDAARKKNECHEMPPRKKKGHPSPDAEAMPRRGMSVQAITSNEASPLLAESSVDPGPALVQPVCRTAANRKS
jgi:hypothetical protein